jgi:amino acid permease
MLVDSGSQITDKKGDVMVWLMLIVNFVCFIIIAHCYLAIYIENRKSAARSGQNDDPNRMREDKALQAKITIMILTDFICWIPFIIICALHNTGWIDATMWYVNLALIVLPVNSVINPLIADETLRKYLDNLTFSDFFSESDISRTKSSNIRENVELTMQQSN